MKIRYVIWPICWFTGFFVASDYVDWPAKIFCCVASGLLCAALDQLDKCPPCEGCKDD